MAHDVKLGQLVEPSQKRDAIHIAVAPVVAAHILAPGEHIGFIDNDQSTVGRSSNPIGIVDPFLKAAVKAGDRFFIFLYPQTITSLRHDWEHPAFIGRADKQADASKAESEKWLRAYALKLKPYDRKGIEGYTQAKTEDEIFRLFMEEVNRYEIFAHGDNLHGLSQLEDADELREHLEIYLGRPIHWEQFTFTCSC